MLVERLQAATVQMATSSIHQDLYVKPATLSAPLVPPILKMIAKFAQSWHM